MPVDEPSREEGAAVNLEVLEVEASIWRSALWKWVAPDPVYYEGNVKTEQASASEVDLEAGSSPQVNAEHAAPAASAAPPLEAFLSPSIRMDGHHSSPESTLCTHCRKWTPVRSPSPTRRPQPQMNDFRTPFPGNAPTRNDDNDQNQVNESDIHTRNELTTRVMVAATDTAHSFMSPPAVNEQRNKVLRLCATKNLKPNLLKKLENFLMRDESLLRARAANLGELVSNGSTPLMAAAQSGNVGAVLVVLKVAPEARLDRNLRGRTALHIASESGNVEIVEILKALHEEKGDNLDTLTDLTGQTPFGVSITSPVPQARQNRRVLEEMLFSPTDQALIGTPAPVVLRQEVLPSLDMAYGHAEMPGRRVIMEDAFCSTSWQNHPSGNEYCLLGVCDGHGDQGKVSKLVAKDIARVMREKTMPLGPNDQDADFWEKLWSAACLEVDTKVKMTKLAGGCTAVFALITKTQIIVANVGDSRCILVQDRPAVAASNQVDLTGTPELIEEAEPTTAAGESSGPDDNNDNTHSQAPATEVGTAEAFASPQELPASSESQEDDFIVVAMSEDHKPNLEQEKARIEKAGLTVVPETFEENGKEVTIHKVEKTKTNQMAVSRSFGDFEYKQNKELGAEEQAVTAMPEVKIHTRDPEKDMFLVLACDGIWDVMGNKEAAKFVVERAEQLDRTETNKNGRLPQIGDDLLQNCFDRGSGDNMTVIVTALPKCMETFSDQGKIQGRALQFPSPVAEEEETGGRVVVSADV